LRLKRDGISRNETKSSRKSTEVVSQPSNRGCKIIATKS